MIELLSAAAIAALTILGAPAANAEIKRLACRRAAVSRAVAELDAPQVTAAYRARRPGMAVAAR